MALTKVSGSIIKDPLNLGEVSIGGTLTYQDVTNVDSLGIGTFRAGINISGGQLDVGSNIKIGNAGVITATSLVATNATLLAGGTADFRGGFISNAGVSTFAGYIDVDGHTNLDNVDVVGIFLFLFPFSLSLSYFLPPPPFLGLFFLPSPSL